VKRKPGAAIPSERRDSPRQKANSDSGISARHPVFDAQTVTKSGRLMNYPG